MKKKYKYEKNRTQIYIDKEVYNRTKKFLNEKKFIQFASMKQFLTLAINDYLDRLEKSMVLGEI